MQKLPEEKLRRARELRAYGTETELLLWRQIRNRKLAGLKFRRQHPLGRYIADFCCEEARLVVEIDGDWHQGEDREEYDQIRDRILTAAGYHTLRIPVTDILEDIQRALDHIQATTAERINAASRQLDGDP